VIASIFSMPLNPPLELVSGPETLSAEWHAENGGDHDARCEQVWDAREAGNRCVLFVREPARPRSPEDANTVWGALSYSWMSALMRTARTRPLRPVIIVRVSQAAAMFFARWTAHLSDLKRWERTSARLRQRSRNTFGQTAVARRCQHRLGSFVVLVDERLDRKMDGSLE
jgi:hypothetical protein